MGAITVFSTIQKTNPIPGFTEVCPTMNWDLETSLIPRSILMVRPSNCSKSGFRPYFMRTQREWKDGTQQLSPAAPSHFSGNLKPARTRLETVILNQLDIFVTTNYSQRAANGTRFD